MKTACLSGLALMSGLVLSACDNDARESVAYTPEMASFANEFDFDPLRGPVRQFRQMLLNQNGEVRKMVTGILNTEGCFEALEFHDIDNNTGAALVRERDALLDAFTKEPRIHLNGHCQLAQLPAAGLMYETDSRGFVTGAKSAEVNVSYRYDSDGYPLGKITSTGGDTFTVSASATQWDKKLNGQVINALNGKTVTTVRQSCEYDARHNPLSCQLEVRNTSAKPPTVAHYSIKNNIEYY
ncbi:YnfC family lipoprotein [Enterobacteriaceae bacterium 4M9]|nr:YnfC family lipoprotein [Enterobacteriaceae bacterium 4M9]